MKNCIKFIVVFVVVALGTVQVSSQTVTGKVVDENLAPIAGATIVMQQTDSTFLATTVSKEDGTFSLVRKSIPFILIVQHMAYQTFRQTFGDSHVGVVRLTANVRELDEMGVTARRPYVRAEGGKLVYDVKSLLKNHIADNAWELLDKLPGVSAGGESVTLQGAQKVAVLMDGKVSTLTAEQLQQLLSRTSADRVAKVEVIYNAPPRYHVSGAVINLVMRNPGQGLEGEFMADYQNRYYSGGGVNASMRYATPKATFDLMYGLNNRPHVQHYRLYSLHRLHDERHDIRQEEHIVGKAWAHDLRASFNYRWKEHWDMDFTYIGMFSPDKKSSSRSEGDFQQSLNERGADSRLHNLAWSVRLGPGVSLGADYTCFHSDDDQHLSAAFGRMVNVPVVAAARLESDIVERYLLLGYRSQIAVADEIFGVCSVRFADGENHLLLEAFLLSSCIVIRPDLLCHTESGPCVWPSGIESGLCQQRRYFLAGDAMLLAHFKVRAERGVNHPLAEKDRDSHHAVVVERKRGIVPYRFSEKNIIVKFGEFWSKFSQLHASGSLCNLFLCHNSLNICH